MGVTGLCKGGFSRCKGWTDEAKRKKAGAAERSHPDFLKFNHLLTLRGSEEIVRAGARMDARQSVGWR